MGIRALFGPLMLATLVACGSDSAQSEAADGSVSLDATSLDANVAPPGCAPPSGNRVTLCGNIVDTESDARVMAVGATGAVCDPDAPTEDGPCSLRLRFIDALRVPTDAQPLAAESLEVLDTGEFRGITIERPFSGYIAIAVDGALESAVEMRSTVVVVSTEMGELRTGLVAFATSQATDDEWTATAGAPFGTQTFADKGPVLLIFRHAGQPVSGVSITRGGMVAPDSYYFEDPDSSRTTIDPTQQATGDNGSGLVINNTLGSTSGSGSEPPGCEWPEALLASGIPGWIFVSVQEAHLIGDPATPCP